MAEPDGLTYPVPDGWADTEPEGLIEPGPERPVDLGLVSLLDTELEAASEDVPQDRRNEEPEANPDGREVPDESPLGP